MKSTLLLLACCCTAPLWGQQRPTTCCVKDAPTLQSYTLSASDKVPALSDGIFREYRLAVFMSYNELHSPKFKGDVEKIKAFWRELEAFLNDIYVRDLGVRFTIIEDERLIEREYHGAYTYDAGTGLINKAIGEDAYDAGLVLDFHDGGGIQGLASLGGVQFTARRAWAIVSSQDPITIAHELGHLFGAPHPFTRGAGLTGEGTEPGSGQSVVSYGYPYEKEFLSLESLAHMRTPTAAADWHLPTKHPNTHNTAPRIDRSRMKEVYRVPRNTFFTLPVYASDAEQDTLNYCFNQYGCTPSRPASFLVFPPQHDPILEFGRRYSDSGALLPGSDRLDVGDYRFWLSVSDALPTAEAIARKQAPLYDSYIANVSVVDATPFKITSELRKDYVMGEKVHLTWSVDKTFFPKGSKVRVLMSDDFGKTYRHVLLPSTDNDGACDVYLPQQLIEKVPTYSYTVPETGQKIDIWFASKGVLRLETIDDDVQYYDFTNKDVKGGGIEVKAAPVVFSGMPEKNYIEIAPTDSLPARPDVQAAVDGKPIAPVYSEQTEGRLTLRTWEVTHGGTTTGVQQFVVRREAPLPPPPVLIDSIALTPPTDTLKVGDTFRLSLVLLPDSATSKGVDWHLSDETVLTHLGDGRFSALTPGDCRVSVRTLDGSALEAWCDVHVHAPTGVAASSRAESREVQVQAHGLTLLLSGLSAGRSVVIYDLGGRPIAHALSRGGELRLTAPASGLYLLAVDGRFVQKVRVSD